MKRLLSIWLRNWPVQRLREQSRRETARLPDAGSRSKPAANEPDRDRPVADREPIILWQSDPRRGRLVVACCARSRRLGVRPGLPIAQAMEFATSARMDSAQSDSARSDSTDRSAKPVVAEHDPVADAVALDRLASGLQNEISPLVAIESLDRRLWAGQVLLEPDTLFCDLSGVTHLFESEAGILAAVHRFLRQRGLQGKLAIADNAASAWAHAHYQPATDFLSGRPVEDLHPLSVNALRIKSETKYTLDRLGIETIGALLRLPRDGLARRLGSELVNRIAEALGEQAIPLQYFHAEQQYTAVHELEYPTDDLQIIADRVGRLSEQIVADLRHHGRGALRLSCRLEMIDHAPKTAMVGLFAPTQDAKHLAGLVESSIESSRPGAPMTKIHLAVLQSGPMRTRQASLLDEDRFALERDGVTEHSLARLVDALTGRLGREAVLGIRLSDNPLPERAYRTYSLTDHRTRRALRRLPNKGRPQRVPRSASGAASGNKAASGGSFFDPGFRPPSPDDARRRPLHLMRHPVPILACGQASPGNSNGHDGSNELPRFQYEGRVRRVVYFWGPERIETGWWDGPTIRRDYYRIETDHGNLWWIFRDLKTGKWFLHGRFH